jgi:hypothetical protein
VHRYLLAAVVVEEFAMMSAIRVLFVVLLFWLSELRVAQEMTKGVELNGDQFEETRALSPEIQEKISKLSQKAFAVGPTSPDYVRIWMRVLKLNPRNENAVVQLGLAGLSAPSTKGREKGIRLLEKAFDAAHVDNTIPMPSLPGTFLAMVIGRYRWEKREYDAAYKFIRLADSALQSLGIENTCTAVSLATMLHPFPNSTQQADEMMDRYVKTAEAFLRKYKNPKLDEKQLSQTVAGAGEDPYIHCALSIFHLSFYYRADVAKAASLRHQVIARVWPQLTYQSPKFPPKASTMKTCMATPDKIKLGIASGFLTPQSSVAADFMGVLQRLDRNFFDVTYIHFCANSGNLTDNFVYQHEEDKVLLLSKSPADQENGAWVTRYHKHVEALDLDILLYLDLTMSPHATRVAMARLARVQATTHGHPVTSGIPSVDYYISWGAAELESAQSHYSENLELLDATVPHQYYEKRHHKNGRSVIDGLNYITRLLNDAAPLTPFQNMAIGTHACKSLTNLCQKWTTFFVVCCKMISKAVSFFIK